MLDLARRDVFAIPERCIRVVFDPWVCLNESYGVAFTDAQREIEIDGNAVGCCSSSSCSSTIDFHTSTGTRNPNIKKPRWSFTRLLLSCSLFGRYPQWATIFVLRLTLLEPILDLREGEINVSTIAESTCRIFIYLAISRFHPTHRPQASVLSAL